MSCRRYKAFHTQGPAAYKLLSPKLLCVRGTALSSQTRTEAKGDLCIGKKFNIGSCRVQIPWGLSSQRLVYTGHAILNSILRPRACQCNFRSTGVICSHRRVPVTRHAVAFCTDCIVCNRLLDTPYSSELLLSRRHITKVCIIV